MNRTAPYELVGDFISSYPSISTDPVQPHRVPGRDIIQRFLALSYQNRFQRTRMKFLITLLPSGKHTLYDYILITDYYLFININILYMFRASSAHLQEDTVVYMQHMLPSLSMRVPGGLSIHSLSELTQAVYLQATTNSHRE